MRVKNVESYDAGYSKSDMLRKCTAAIAASALICGGAASCNKLDGDVRYEYDGGMEVVSDIGNDVSDSDMQTLTLDGEAAYLPSEE